MNPFDTPDAPSTPIPSATPAPATIDIDSMLANLGQQAPATTATPSPTMQLSSLDKPTSVDHNPPLSEKKGVWIPSRMKKILSLLATIIFIIVGYRFVSVQYPLETTSFMTSITSSFTSIMAIIQKNQNSTFMTGSSEGLTNDDIMTGLDTIDPVATPLSDAIAEAASGFAIPSSSEQVRDVALSGNDTISGMDYSGSATPSSGSAMLDTMDQTMAHAVASSDTEKRDVVRQKLLDMKEVLNQKLIDLSLGNNTLHLSLVKVTLKNIDLTISLSEQASNSTAWDEVDAKVEQIQSLYDRVEKL